MSNDGVKFGNNGLIDLKPGFSPLRGLPVHAWFSASARPRCQRRPIQPILKAPAEARSEAQSTLQSQTAKTDVVEDLEARSLKFPLNLNRSHKCLSRTKASVDVPSANRNQKCASRQEALEDLNATIHGKCQSHNSISKNSQDLFCLFGKIESSC